jgi:hypothetical protein
MCPTEAITFGKREDLLYAAKQKMKNYPKGTIKRF